MESTNFNDSCKVLNPSNEGVLTNLSIGIASIVLSWLLIIITQQLCSLKTFFLSKEEKKIRALVACKAELKFCMEKFDCHPIMLRLAWSDAATHDKSYKSWPDCGGVTGSIRFQSELAQKNNAGLSKAIDILRPLKSKYYRVSWADLIQMAGAMAVELSGGPQIPMRYGRRDLSIAEYNSFLLMHKKRVDYDQEDRNDQDSTRELDDKQNQSHIVDSTNLLASRLPGTLPPYPDGAPSPEVHIRNVFFRMGLSNQDTVALIGAHTIGRAFKDRSGVCPFSSGDQGATSYTRLSAIAKKNNVSGIGMSGGCSWTKNWLEFDNSYFRRLVDDDGDDLELLWLPTDQALFDCPEYRPYFILYGSDEKRFFRDYANAHKKMSELGAHFNPTDGIILPATTVP